MITSKRIMFEKHSHTFTQIVFKITIWFRVNLKFQYSVGCNSPNMATVDSLSVSICVAVVSSGVTVRVNSEKKYK